MLKEIINIWKSNSLMDQAWKQSFEMLNITHDMFLEAVRVLRESEDRDIREEIRAKDKKVNAYEQEVRRKVMTHLAMKNATDLPSAMVLVSIIIDIERLGDYTKNIVDLIGFRKGQTLHGLYLEDELTRIETAIKQNFEKTKECLESSHSDKAITTLSELEWVAEACEKSLKSLVKGVDSNLSSGDSASLAVYFRYLKRIHAHLRNITTSIVNPFDRIGFKPNDAQ